MTRVFIAGSIKISQLNQEIKKRIGNVVSNGFKVIIGDANGVDRAVQEYLFSQNYQNVLVFCMGGRCRHNIGNWQIRSIKTDKAKKDFKYYAIKDFEMVKEADYGFMIWDGKSKGTLNSIINLLKLDKKVLVYLNFEKKFHTLHSLPDLNTVLSKCDSDSLEYFEEKLELSKLLSSPSQPQASFNYK